MRVLITGLGSIGQRHYRNLRTLGHEVAVFRTSTSDTPHISAFIKEQKDTGLEIVQYRDLEEAFAGFKPEVVFVTNPNSKHIDIALKAARAGMHLFIEKPLSHTMDGLTELGQLTREKSLKVMVGYNLRWHPLLMKMKDMLESGTIGTPLAASVEMGECIIDWHPWENYLDAYAPYKEGGGGAVLCFSHDLDYLYWFFGLPQKVLAVGGKMTPLGGDAEDMVKALCAYESGLIADMHLDYWQRPKRRTFEVIGTEGTLFWDYDEGSLTVTLREAANDPQVHTMPSSFERNTMFIDEAKAFIKSIEQDTCTPIPLEEGADVLHFSQMIKSQIGF